MGVLPAPTLDVPTLFVAIVLVSATLTAMVALVAERDQRDGMFFWAAALAAHTGAYALFALRGQISDVSSVVLANTLLSTAFALFGEALCQFFGRRPKRLLLWTPVALVSVSFMLLIDMLPARLVLASAVFGLQIVVILGLLRSAAATTGRGAVLVGLGVAALLPVLLARAATAFNPTDNLRVFTAPGQSQALAFLVVVSSVILVTFGFVLMNKDRSDQQSRKLSMFDELTGLPNRRQSLLALAQQVAAARRGGQPLAVLMLDIDHFKRVNDLHGHLVGDAALRHLAQTLAARVRSQDIPGRFGGEEFLCVLPATSASGGQQLAEAVRAAVAAQAFSFGSMQSLQLTVSVGVAELPSGGACSAEALIGAADLAMYRAKVTGRNRVETARSDDFEQFPGAVR